MTTYLALLRAINVGGRNAVAMSDLRGLPEKLGFTDARTLLQTGNLVFSGSARPSAALERELEAAAKKRLRLETDFLVRTDKEWERLVGANPFPAEAKDDPSHLVVMFLKVAPRPGRSRRCRRRSWGARSFAPSASRPTSCIPTGSAARS